MSEILVYGTDWCGDTVRTLRHLDKLGVPYEFIDIDENEAGEDKVIKWNQGKRRVPTLELITDEKKVLSVPSDRQLEAELRTLGFLN